MTIAKFCNRYLNPFTNWKNDNYNMSVVSPSPYGCCLVRWFRCINNEIVRCMCCGGGNNEK